MFGAGARQVLAPGLRRRRRALRGAQRRVTHIVPSAAGRRRRPTGLAVPGCARGGRRAADRSGDGARLAQGALAAGRGGRAGHRPRVRAIRHRQDPPPGRVRAARPRRWCDSDSLAARCTARRHGPSSRGPRRLRGRHDGGSGDRRGGCVRARCVPPTDLRRAKPARTCGPESGRSRPPSRVQAREGHTRPEQRHPDGDARQPWPGSRRRPTAARPGGRGAGPARPRAGWRRDRGSPGAA